MKDAKKTMLAAGVAVGLGAVLASGALAADDVKPRVRDLGIEIGVLQPGKWNAITDVEGVLVGQVSLIDDAKGMNTGVTAILPHAENVFQNKVPAGIFLGNAFGKMTGYPQVKELGNLETPIVLTNTLNVAAGLDGIIDYTFSFPENADVRSVNDIRSRFVKSSDVLAAIEGAKTGPVEEGVVGAGCGTVAFGFKAGIGTASRVLPKSMGGWTVGVLVQSNFGGLLNVKGVEVGKALGRYPYQKEIESADGSIMMIVATDAPLDGRNLERLAKRAFMGMTKSGGIASNGSGDFVIAFSTAKNLRVPHDAADLTLEEKKLVRNDDMTPIFMAAIEATEEAVLNSLFRAHDVTGFDGKTVTALPVDQVLGMLREHGALNDAK